METVKDRGDEVLYETLDSAYPTDNDSEVYLTHYSLDILVCKICRSKFTFLIDRFLCCRKKIMMHIPRHMAGTVMQKMKRISWPGTITWKGMIFHMESKCKNLKTNTR